MQQKQNNEDDVILNKNVMVDRRKLAEDFHKEQLSLLIENVKMKRQLVHLFITISSGIIGGLLLFKESILVKNIAFIYCGMFLLLCNILYGFYYLVGFLSSEFRYLDKFYKTVMNGLQENEKLQTNYFKNPTEANLNEINLKQKVQFVKMRLVTEEFEKKVKKFNHGLYFLFYFFFFGLVFLFLSILPVSFFQKIILWLFIQYVK